MKKLHPTMIATILGMMFSIGGLYKAVASTASIDLTALSCLIISSLAFLYLYYSKAQW